MNYKRYSVFSSLFFGFIIFTTFQNGNAQENNCDCLANLNYLVTTVKENYIGYRDKVTPAHQERLDYFTDSLRTEAQKVGMGNCMPILWSYTYFFRDVHLQALLRRTSTNQDFIRNTFAGEEKIDWSTQQLEQYFNNSKPKDWIEGIWEARNPTYTIAIIRQPSKTRDFAGFILQADSLFWMPGQIKIEIKKTGDVYKALNYSRDHIPFPDTLAVDRTGAIPNFEIAAHIGQQVFYKRYPTQKQDRKKVSSLASSSLPAYVGQPHFQLLDPETALLTLPTFAYSMKRTTDSIVEANRKTILATKNLIIDIRNNTGGTVLSYWKILPFLYTDPITYSGETIWATPTNIEAYKDYASSNPYRPEEITKQLLAIYTSLTQHPGELVTVPIGTFRQDTIYPYPVNVAVLMNDGSVSAAELFALDVQQSKKVILFGQPTKGGVDYLDANTIPLLCPNYSLVYPLSRHPRMSETPLPAPRLQPHVLIPPNTPDWIAFVRAYLKRTPAKAQK